MKNVKVLFWVLAIIAITTTSCERENDFLGFDDFQEEEFDGGNIDNQGDEGVQGALTLYKIINDQLTKVKDFNVGQNLKPFQSNTVKHEDMWNFFTRLIPQNERFYINEFEVFHGGGELLGYVAPNNGNDLGSWKMGLAIDVADGLDKIDFSNDFTYTCVHEFGHVLTLNNMQLDAFVSEDDCSNYHAGEGCSNANSYINRIFEIGWKDIYNEFLDIQSDNEAEDFYQKYADRFVTPYASSNPGEDVAEVFSVFVTEKNKPTGNSIADQKVKAMYDYPELVQLREKIREQPELRALQPGSWVKPGRKKVCKHHTHKKQFSSEKEF